ncbi:hypothetical protein AQ490_15340 [Wenjunlia vitaminophila]|uniref:Dienelactone hydrolase domain-containing protein n=1 Tax=Wenjunlia vitaminophila TaxID=76728 RepID=A0A0T6LWQ8_WENVI|nr:dienelactone hydrolase family protein [Wenjunlia vitaminophila]KRV50457.1 hypothetical protein AQ490_15340 [Wenjunlia vitaminophila]
MTTPERVAFGSGAAGPGGYQHSLPGGGPGGYFHPAPGPGPHPAVVVVPAISGVNDYVQRQAARLAEAGYSALLLDYYARQQGQAPDLSSPEKVMEAVWALPDPQVLDDLSAAVAWLGARPEVEASRVGVVGFCIGGSYALLGAAHVPGLACAVTFYGMLRYAQLSPNKPESPLDAVSKAQCPVLGHFGDADAIVPLADARELADRLRGKPAEIYTYPGAGHAFHEDFRPQVYRPAAAAAAWERTCQYLDYYLRVAP